MTQHSLRGCGSETCVKERRKLEGESVGLGRKTRAVESVEQFILYIFNTNKEHILQILGRLMLWILVSLTESGRREMQGGVGDSGGGLHSAWTPDLNSHSCSSLRTRKNNQNK